MDYPDTCQIKSDSSSTRVLALSRSDELDNRRILLNWDTVHHFIYILVGNPVLYKTSNSYNSGSQLQIMIQLSNYFEITYLDTTLNFLSS